MLRLYTSQVLEKGATLNLDERSFHHAIHVIRMKRGDTLHLFNGSDGEWECTLLDVGKKNATVTITDKVRDARAPDPLHLYFASLKGDRQFFLIEKGTELGVTDFHPIQTDHTQMHKINFEKFQDQALHAAQQCERFDIPTIHPTQKLDQALKNLGNAKIIACVERSSHTYDIQALKEIFKAHPKVLIGPEGGFSEAEKRILENHPNTIPLSLGENILRAETAALSMLSIIQFFKTL